MPKSSSSKQASKKSLAALELETIRVTGAREHNLKNIDVEFPKRNLVVITGVSGSGKSSLAFDTLFAEGQRRYMESLSAYARQFLGQLEKPKYETLKGLSPTISIEQKSASRNPRSTVGTITEIYDYLRVLYARVGTQTCLKCGKKVGRGDATSMVDQILRLPAGTKVLLLAPLIENRKGEHRDLIQNLRGEGYSRLRIDGIVSSIEDVQTLAKNKKHNIDVVLDRLQLQSGAEFKERLTDSVEQCLKVGQGQMIVHVLNREDIRLSEARSCCGRAYPALDPPAFSFNSPAGMCRTCNGLGTVLSMDPKKVVPDHNLTIREGAVLPWENFFIDGKPKENAWGIRRIYALQKAFGIDIDVPWKKLSKKNREIILNGAPGVELTLTWKGKKGKGTWKIEEEGLLNRLMRRYRQTKSDSMKTHYQRYMSNRSCQTCGGKRLQPEILAVHIERRSIMDFTSLSVKRALESIKKLKLNRQQEMIAGEVIKEITSRLQFLVNVGLDYLSLDRSGPTLSGGEAQRIRLASQIGSDLTGVLYILDEPSIGLHQKDNKKLIETLCRLRDIGNTVLVVEHDQETMEQADWILDLGPGAGHLGGQVVGSGPYSDILKNKKSLTGQYLSGRRRIEIPDERRKPGKEQLEVSRASANNLQNVDVQLPLGTLTCVTGVSGAGKSTLVNQILYPALMNHLHHSTLEIGKVAKIKGLDYLDKVINIDQKPIGRTPRSNPATYTKLFDLIRDFYALLPESRKRGYKKGRFSFNVKGGRCENCQGDGLIKVEMHFLADVYVPCEQCQGLRFNSATLEVLYKGHSISDVLNLSVGEARELFESHPKIVRILDTLVAVGLSYIKLGQAATTLSGGEAQRVKLSRELAKQQTGKTLYILDEPTTGLHFYDIEQLIGVLQSLVDQGNSVLVIEHNMDVIKCADWVIDLGPDGGEGGGRVIAKGTPEAIAKRAHSYTGQALRGVLS